MKKYMLCLMLLLITAAPLAHAIEAEVRANVGTNDAESDTDNSDASDTDAKNADEDETGEDSDKDDSVDSSGKGSAERKLAARASVAVRKAADEPGREFAARVVAEAREKHRDFLQQALIQCERAEQQEKCKENVEARIEKLNGLQEKDLERLERFQERLKASAKAEAELKIKETYAKYKHDAQARLIAKDKSKAARERYLEAKDKYFEHRKEFRENRERFLEVKERAKACKEDCDAERKEVKAHAKRALINAADAMLEQMKQVKSKVEQSEALTELEAERLKDAIDAHIEAIVAAKVAIEALDATADAEAFARATAALRTELQAATKTLKAAAGMLVQSRIGGVIVRATKLQERLNAFLLSMAEKGLDTTAVEGLVEDFNQAIQHAQEMHEKAVAHFVDGQLEAGHAALKESHKYLQQAHQLLKDILQELREQNASNVLEEADVEASVAAASE